MKIEDIEKACKLNKELKEIQEILKLQLDKDELLSSVLVLFHDNERYNLNPLLSEEAKIRIMSIILSDFGTRKEQIERQIKEL